MRGSGNHQIPMRRKEMLARKNSVSHESKELCMIASICYSYLFVLSPSTLSPFTSSPSTLHLFIPQPIRCNYATLTTSSLLTALHPLTLHPSPSTPSPSIPHLPSLTLTSDTTANQASSTNSSPHDILPPSLRKSSGGEGGREGCWGKGLGKSHWLAPFLLGEDLSGRSHQQRGMSVGALVPRPPHLVCLLVL